MSDTLTNALQQSAHSSNVLQGIMNPAVVNPLAGYGSAISAVSGLQGLQKEQMGQQLTRLNYTAGTLADLLNQEGPISEDQVHAVAGQHVGDGIYNQDQVNSVLSTMPHNTPDNPNAVRGWLRQLQIANLGHQQQIMAGFNPTTFNTGGQLVTRNVPTMPGVGGAGAPSVTLNTTLTPESAMGAGIQYPATEEDVKAGRAPSVGAPVYVSGPDVITRFGLGGILPPGARMVGGGGGGGSGPSVVDSSGKPVSPANPPRLLNEPGQPPAAPTAPAASPGAYQGTGTGTAADTVPIYQPPAGTPPAASVVPQQPPPAASPGSAIVAAVAAAKASGKPVPIPGGSGLVANPDGSVGTPGGGGISGVPSTRPPLPANAPRAALDGGVQVASANPLQPVAVGAPGPPSPLVPGDVNAIMAGINRARATPAAGTQTAYNTFSVGPGSEQVAGNKASADKLATDDLAATEWQSTKLPYVEALKNYGEGTKTGPTTDFWNQVAGTIRTPLAKIGINVGPLADTTERVDALGKWLASIQSTNPVSAKSDAELAQVLKGSASTHINEVAGEDMVKAGFTLRRMGAALNNDWHNNPALQTQYGTYLRYLGDMNNKIDPRAFSVDMLNDAQKARLRTSLQNGSEADAQRFEASLALARRSRQVP